MHTETRQLSRESARQRLARDQAFLTAAVASARVLLEMNGSLFKIRTAPSSRGQHFLFTVQHGLALERRGVGGNVLFFLPVLFYW